jgi:hypothetical protein
MIDSTEFGSITVEGKTYHSDNFIVSWDGEVRKIHTVVRHLFGNSELNEVLKKEPELIIVGTGVSGLLEVSEEVRKTCEEKGIELVEMLSKEAIQKFNDALKQGKKVVGFIHATC